MAANEFGHAWVRFGHRVFERLATLRMPVIAALNGHALGGGLELAAAADIRIAESQIRIGLPETSLGMVPGWSGTQRLTKRFGAQIVRRMVLGGEMFSAEEARGYGLVDAVVETGTVLTAARGLRCAASLRADRRRWRLRSRWSLPANGEDNGVCRRGAGSIPGCQDRRPQARALRPLPANALLNSRENGDDGPCEATGASRCEDTRIQDADRRQIGVEGVETGTIERVALAMASPSASGKSATKDDVHQAIAAARRAFDQGPWPRMRTAADSAQTSLLKAADMISDAAEELRPISMRSRLASRSRQVRRDRRFRATSGASRPPLRAICTVKATIRREARWASCCARRSALSRSSQPSNFPIPDCQPEITALRAAGFNGGRQAVRADVGFNAGARSETPRWKADMPAGVVNILNRHGCRCPVHR